MYDTNALCDLLGQAAQDESSPEETSRVQLLAHLLYFAVATSCSNADGRCQAKDLQVSFNQFWRLAVSHLTLERFSELLKANKTNTSIVEPLLKALYVILQPMDSFKS